jgi:hypothetical protein
MLYHQPCWVSPLLWPPSGGLFVWFARIHWQPDPFDRLLLAQAESEGLLLITADALVARYPGPVRHQTSF